MWKKTLKQKRQTAASPEVIELYKNNEFVSDSLESVCASAVKITADGQITTKTIGKVGDRHLQAELKLPGLQERCAVSSNKDLFTLSTTLAENETEHQVQAQVEDKYMLPEMLKAKNRLPRKRFANMHARDCKFVKDAQNLQEGSPIQLQRPTFKDYKQNEMPKQAPDQNLRKKQKKIKKTKPQAKNYAQDSTDDSCYETAVSRQMPRHKRRSADKAATKCCDCTTEPEKTQLDNCADPSWKDDDPQLSKRTKVDKLVHNMKGVVKFLDDWHSYTMLLFLGTFIYLLYMLCYDISIYVSEERRYLAKMRSAGFVARCFYYIMRLLKVPIF